MAYVCGSMNGCLGLAIRLWDELERWFASPEEMQQRVRDLQEQSAVVLDNESKERALVGEVISTLSRSLGRPAGSLDGGRPGH